MAPENPALGPGQAAALEVILLLADTDARWGDYESALSLLECAASVGELPYEYASKRERWALCRESAARLAA